MAKAQALRYTVAMQPPQSVVELLQALIQIPSVNPSGNPGTDRVGEQLCAEYVARFLASIGATVELRQVLPGRPNIVAHFPSATPGKPRLLFAPHTDTVSVAGMTIDPFGGAVRDERVYGRGASDTKGPMAAMLWALSAMREQLDSLPFEIWFAGLAGEEAGQHGACALAEEEQFDFVIAGEPTSLQVVNTHKGCTNLRLVTRGLAVHSSQPSMGENAIYKMATVIRFIESNLATELRKAEHPILGHSTVSVGTISGGSKTNVVPDYCEATVDIRTVPMQDTPEFLDQLRATLRTACPDLEIAAGHAAPLYTSPDHPIIQTLRTLGAECAGAPWFCDAAVFARKGTPAIALGPGSIAQAHTKDEWISVQELERGVEFFKAFLRAL